MNLLELFSGTGSVLLEWIWSKGALKLVKGCFETGQRVL